MTIDTIEPEFSRPFVVDRLGATPAIQTVEADAAEREALARRLRLVGIERLSAELRIQREPGIDLIRVAGRLEADVVQTCVVTLEPFPSHVEDSFTVEFSSHIHDPTDEISLDMDYEPPEPIVGGAIDVGELVAQYLSLALDPHPRSPGAALDAALTEAAAETTSPFAILKRLKPQG